MSAQSTWGFIICHISTTGSANNRVVCIECKECIESYRILCSVLLGTADNVIWPVLSFQVDAHWGKVKGIKSYLQCIEGAKIWQKQLSPSRMGYPPESSKPDISQHSVGFSGSVSMFVCLCVCRFKCVCVYLNMCALVYVCVRWLRHLKVTKKQLSPSCQHNPHEAS
jgi:hypothetical protein